MVEGAEREKLREVVAGRLRDLILEEQLQPGDRLPTETQLAERFGVSRLSLREATKSLEFLGVIRAKPGQGLTVGTVNMDRVTEYLGFHPALQGVPAEVLIETRIVIEVGVLPHLGLRMAEDPTIYLQLQEINRQLREATNDAKRWIELDVTFHRELVRLSGLSPLLPFGDLVAIFFDRFRDGGMPLDYDSGIQHHQDIIDALHRGDVETADQRMRLHIRSWFGRLGLRPFEFPSPR